MPLNWSKQSGSIARIIWLRPSARVRNWSALVVMVVVRQAILDAMYRSAYDTDGGWVAVATEPMVQIARLLA